MHRCACTESKTNTIDTKTGPIVYLLKLLVYQAGFSSLAKVVKSPQLKWMVPKELEEDEVCL